jgi:DeoR family transcriptional regulator, glycerol-3-phosphate regulon repressor
MQMQLHQMVKPQPNALNPRQLALLSLVQLQRGISVAQLADYLQVSLQTVRRDVQRLSEEGRLARFHGGVRVLTSTMENIAYQQRETMNILGKKRIAREVAHSVPNDCSLILNIGTTTEAIAHALMRHIGLRVITNSLNIASILSHNPKCEVIVVGGVVRCSDKGIVGEEAIDFIQQFKVDLAIIGISGIDANGILRDYDYREVKVAQTIMRHAQEVWLAADASKFDRSAMVEVGHISQINRLFTDAPLSESFSALLAKANVRLQLASPPKEMMAAATEF